MANFLPSWTALLTFFGIIFGLWYIYYRLVTAKYWKKKNITHLEPVFLLGSSWKSGIFTEFRADLIEWYNQYKEKKLLGMHFFTMPSLLINDVNIVKNVLVRDFHHFHDRGLEINVDKEPLLAHLFNISGSKWRNLRVKLTPTFTSGKMKMMFPIMVECAEELQKFLETPAKLEETIDLKDVLARFTTDVISSCAFGIQTNSLKNPDGEFRKYGRKIFEVSLFQAVANMIIFVWPLLGKILNMRQIPKDLHDFFMNAVKETVDYREKNKTQRNDFMQLLIELKNKGKIEDADSKYQNNKEEEILSKDEKASGAEQKFTLTDAAAQAFVFFIAGFETSSTTMTFAFYELALNPDVQKTLQDEIDKILAKHDNKITYEAVAQMEYLDWVVQETLRKYPPVPSLFRECTKDYYLPEFNSTIDKGTFVMIPVVAMQYDPDVYPNPEKFDPTRFSYEEKSKRDPFFHLPFGEGPRNCIGNRFGLLQSKVGIISILSKYNVEVAKETLIPMKYDIRAFVLTPDGGKMHLKINLRK